jgi:arsenate reductase (glutaredoxin)
MKVLQGAFCAITGLTMNITLYGIKNCDTVQRARQWLDAQHVQYHFHDYKVLGIDRARLQQWCDALGWQTVLNRSSSTFRQLAAAEKHNLSAATAMTLMLAQPTMIKRPIIEIQQATQLQWQVGFKPEQYAQLLKIRNVMQS